MEPKAHLYAQLARLSKALSSPMRLALVDILSQGARTVERLARETGQSPANASQHLQVLRAARLVEADKNGLYVTYRLASPAAATLLVRLRRLGEAQLSELRVAKEALRTATGDVESIDRATLMQRLRSGEAILIDVRPRDEYDAGHLPRAISIPLAELRRRMRELPKRCEVVAYCRGPYCMLSVEAARLLTRRGRRASRLEDGVAEWRDAGLSIVERRKEVT
jgi:rhodanese-related sulfurtransferase/DNA-binding transcriptional ArsR family regulator